MDPITILLLLAVVATYVVAPVDSKTHAFTRGLKGAAEGFLNGGSGGGGRSSRRSAPSGGSGGGSGSGRLRSMRDGYRDGVEKARKSRTAGTDNWSRIRRAAVGTVRGVRATIRAGRRAGRGTGNAAVATSGVLGKVFGALGRSGRLIADYVHRRNGDTAEDPVSAPHETPAADTPPTGATNTTSDQNANGARPRYEEYYFGPSRDQDDFEDWDPDWDSDWDQEPTGTNDTDGTTVHLEWLPDDTDQPDRTNRPGLTPAPLALTEGTTPMPAPMTEITNINDLEVRINAEKQAAAEIVELAAARRQSLTQLLEGYQGAEFGTAALDQAVAAIADSGSGFAATESLAAQLVEELEAGLKSVRAAHSIGEMAAAQGARGRVEGFTPA